MFNANNYGYNPYGTYIPQRNIPQPLQPQQEAFNSVQSRPVLNGKQVDSVDVVRAMDIPLDGSISYFPLADGSAIVSKQLQNDGTSKIVVFKPFIEPKEEPKYVTITDMEKAIDDLRKELKVGKKDKDE